MQNPSLAAAYHHPISHSLYPPQFPPPPNGSGSKMFYSYVPNAVKTRKRTSAQQLAILEDVFVTDKKPNGPKRKDLSGKLSMTPREVQVWFQNRRAKEKKQAAQRNGQDGEGSSSTTAPVAGADTGSDGDSPRATPAAELEDSTSPSSTTQPAIPTLPTIVQPPSLLPSGPFPKPLSPPSAASAVYDQRRSSLPVTNAHPPQFLPPSADPSLYRRASHATLLDAHPCSPLARRASFDPRGQATRRFTPYGQPGRPSLTHRPSAPEIYGQHNNGLQSFQQQPEYVPSPVSATPAFEGWTTTDPFGQGSSSNNNSNMHSTSSFDAYEFPPKSQDPRGSVTSLASVPYSDVSTGPSTGGAYFSDASTAPDDGERRGSWALLPHPPVLDRRASLGDPGAGGAYGHEQQLQPPPGHGHGRASEFSNASGSGSENGTVYPSPPSDRARSASLPHTGGIPQQQPQQQRYYGLPGANNSNGSGHFLPPQHSLGPSPNQSQEFVGNGYAQQQPQQDFTGPQQPPQFFAPPPPPPQAQQQGFISPAGYDSRRPSFDANAAPYDQRRPSYDANSMQPSFDRRPSYDGNALASQLPPPVPAYDQRRPSYDGSVGVNEVYDQRRPSYDANVYDQRRPSLQSFDGSASYEQPFGGQQYDAAHGHAGGPYDTAGQGFDGYGQNGYQ